MYHLLNKPACTSILLAVITMVAMRPTWCQEDEEAEPVLEIVDILEGERSVASELNQVFEEQDAIFEPVVRPWWDWKQKFLDRTGIAFGISALSLYQRATDSREDKDGWGQRYRLNVSRTLGDNRNSRINARVEYRASVPNYLAPTQLSRAVGTLSLNTGSGYPNEFDLDLSVLNWTQTFAESSTVFAVGRLSSGSYIDPTPIEGLTGGFVNGAFGNTPAFSGPGAGALGFVAKRDLSLGFWGGAHIYDANAVSGEFNDDAFDDNEWLKALEVGWAPSPQRYATDRVTLTYWDKDERQDRGIRAGHGWIASASYQPMENLQTFIRWGHSNGGGGARAENALSAGIDWAVRPGHGWVLGAAWAEPTARRRAGNPRDEYVIETSYRFRLVQSVQLLLDAQLVLDPANNPDESSIWVFGLRTALQL